MSKNIKTLTIKIKEAQDISEFMSNLYSYIKVTPVYSDKVDV